MFYNLIGTQIPLLIGDASISLENILEMDRFNPSRVSFLTQLDESSAADRHGNHPWKKHLRQWTAAKNLEMFTSLTEAERNDIRLFFATAKSHGGLAYLKDQ